MDKSVRGLVRLWAAAILAVGFALAGSGAATFSPVVGAARVHAAATTLSVQTVSVGQNPNAVAVDAVTKRVFVVNQGPLDAYAMPLGAGSVTMLDATTHRVITTTPVGFAPKAIAVDVQLGRIYILNLGPTAAGPYPTAPGSVTMLDALTGKIITTTKLGIVSFGAQMLIDSGTHTLLVLLGHTTRPSGNYAGGIAIVDEKTGVLRSSVSLPGIYPLQMGLDVSVNHLFVTPGGVGYTLMLDATTGKVLKTLSFAGGPLVISPSVHVGVSIDGHANTYPRTQRIVLFDTRTGAVLHDFVLGLLDSPDGLPVVAIPEPSPRIFLSYGLLQATETELGLMIDPGAGAILYALPRPVDGPTMVVGGADPARDQVFLVTVDYQKYLRTHTMPRGEVQVFAANFGRKLATAPVGRMPVALTDDAASGRIYVVNQLDNTLSIIAAPPAP
jgi:DNA-binding beta-propeller fold protein YncE